MDQIEGATPSEEVVEIPETPVEPKSIDDTIRDTLREINARGETETPKTPATPETPEEVAQRIRDDKGRFAKCEAAPNTPPATPETPVTIPPEVQRLGFRKEAADAYAAAPEVLRQEIQRRADDWHRGMQAVQPRVQFADSIDRTLAPFQQTLKNLNVTPEAAIDALLRADHGLRYGSPEAKRNTLFGLAQQFGIDLTGAPPAPVDQNFAHLQSQVTQQHQWIQNQEAQRKQEQQQRTERENAELNSQIASFAADPKHSHFESVKGHMSALLQGGNAKDLADAYEQAVYANPTTRALVLAEQQATAKAEAGKKAQAAKTVASVNVRTRPALSPSTPIGSMDDTIRQTYRRLTAA